MPLSTRIQLTVDAKLTGAAGLVVPEARFLQDILLQLTNGTGAGQADKMFTGTRALAGSATEDLDLAGVLADAFGSAITNARVKALYVRAAPANLNNVVLGAAASNPWATFLNATGTITLRPGAFVLGAAGVADATAYAVTGSTGDLLKVANSAGGSSVSYDIAIIGASA